jgi:hypothetical protein
MSGSYLDAMSDSPSWTSMMGSEKGTRPLRIRRCLSGRWRVSSDHHKRAPLRDGSTAAHSGERRASASGLVGGAAAHRQQPRVVCPDLDLGHYREPARRQRAHLRVNVTRRRAGQRAAPHLRSAGRRPPSLSRSSRGRRCSLGRREAGRNGE